MKKSGYFYGRLISTYGQRLRHYRVDAWLRVLIWFMLLLLCFRWWVGHVNLVMYITFHANMIHLWCLASLKHKTSQHPQHSNSTIRLHHSPNHPSLHNLPPIINIPARIHITKPSIPGHANGSLSVMQQRTNKIQTHLSRPRLISRATARRHQPLSCCWGSLLGWRCWWALRLQRGFGCSGLFGDRGNVGGLILWIFGRRMVVFDLSPWQFEYLGLGPGVRCLREILGYMLWGHGLSAGYVYIISFFPIKQYQILLTWMLTVYTNVCLTAWQNNW